MPHRTLDEWLNRIEALHPKKWDLGLTRVGSVAGRMDLLAHTGKLFLVAGTNGKGSTVALIEHLARAHGYRTGASTSPHLLRFNERIQIDGADVCDEEICASFARIEAARGDTTLTYFEFAALASLDIFRRHRPDVIVLEVGLGGRLDAMNIVSPDVAVVTSIDLDHQGWLGEDREAIGREKAGILRAGVPAIIGDPDPPASLLAHAHGLGANILARGREFGSERVGAEWTFRGRDNGGREVRIEHLPLSRLHLDNAVTALAAWAQSGLATDPHTVARVLAETDLIGRCQVLPGSPTVVLDVAHNPHAARNLALRLGNKVDKGETSAVVAMLRDKDCEGFFAPLMPQVDRWYLAPLMGDRGQSAEELAQRLRVGRGSIVGTYDRVVTAFRDAVRQAGKDDRIVVTGSFLTVAAVLEALRGS